MSTKKCMRSVAPDYEKHPLRFPFYASPKLDGIRGYMDNGSKTKSGKTIPNNYIRNWLDEYMPNGMDFEIISGAPNLTKETYAKTFSAAMTIEGVPDFDLYVFDVFNMDELTKTERISYMSKVLGESGLNVLALDTAFSRPYVHVPGTQRVVLVLPVRVENQEQLDAYYDLCLENGYEGVIIAKPDGLYKHGKCTEKEQIQMKLKPEDTRDALILSMYEAMHNGNEAFTNEIGETKRTSHQENKIGMGTLGGFNVRDLISGLEFKVGPGKLSHKERKEAWDNQANYTHIKYTSMTYGVKDAPRHPRFDSWLHAADIFPKE